MGSGCLTIGFGEGDEDTSEGVGVVLATFGDGVVIGGERDAKRFLAALVDESCKYLLSGAVYTIRDLTVLPSSCNCILRFQLASMLGLLVR